MSTTTDTQQLHSAHLPILPGTHLTTPLGRLREPLSMYRWRLRESKRSATRRSSQAMLVALVKKSNAADGRFGRALRGLQRFVISALMFFD